MSTSSWIPRLVPGGAAVAVGLGLDIGGTKVSACLASDDGELHHFAMVGTPRPPTGGALVQTVSALVTRELREADDQGLHVVSIGIGTAGVVDPRTGVVRSATATLQDWEGMDLSARLQAVSGVPASVDNDVNAMALGEVRAGAGRGFSRCLVVAVGTGVGGALASDGRIDRGATGTAGEVGHLPIGPVDGPPCTCGRSGHLEGYASGPAMVRRYHALGGGAPAADYRRLVAVARAGDPLAVEVLAAGGSTLGRALGGLTNVFDPQIVILGGGVMATGPLLFRPLTEAFRSELLPGPAAVVLRLARFRGRAGVIGAALMGLGQRHGAAVGGHRPVTTVGTQ